MRHDIAIIWIGDPRQRNSVLKDGNTIVAGPGEKVRVDTELAERLVREGKARYPKN